MAGYEMNESGSDKLEKRKMAMKPTGSLEVEMAFKKASKPKDDMSHPMEDMEEAIEFVKQVKMDEADREHLLALLGDEEIPESESAPAIEEVA